VIFQDIGEVTPDFYVTGLSWSPICLLDGPNPALFEGGITAASNLYLDSIKSILGERTPVWLFLTHVHWDHCGAISTLLQAYPSLRIGASKRAAEIMHRPNAIQLMAKLNRNARKDVEKIPGIDVNSLDDLHFQPFQVTDVLQDGRIIEIGSGLSVQVIGTPGHTRDHFSYFIPEKGVLIASEASGCLDAAGKIISEFLVDYNDYLASLKKLASLNAEFLYQGHRIVFSGHNEVRQFFEQSIRETERFKDYAVSLLQEESGDTERVAMRIKAEMWDTNPGPKQPEIPYLINLRAQVNHLAVQFLKKNRT
jgi:glyoxylase-like metal-dependent hydrolase (beta-lactamase superfamily II)